MSRASRATGIPESPPLVAIVGPTATGKSAVAVAVAEAIDAEVVSCDALQVYRGMEIGTAKPTVEQRKAVPHHLLDLLEPHEPFSAGRFAELARAAIAEIHARGKRVVLAGGSGLYLRALTEGLSPMPVIDTRLRARLARLQRDRPRWAEQALALLDRAAAEQLEPGDRQRIGRALELALGSGRRWSEWRAARSDAGALPTLWFGLTLPRALLYDQIAARVRRMIEAGWAEEVTCLLAGGLSPEAPAFQAIGYRQLVRHHLGERSLEEAVEEIVLATRRYAKRQLTWFRRQVDVEWLPADDLAAVVPRIVERVVSDSESLLISSRAEPEVP